MLIGEYSYSIDVKGRVNFPSRLREHLGERFILAKGLGDSCIFVYSLEEWTNIENKIKQLPMTSARNIQRFLFASAIDVEPDKQGRIVIPQNLREYANLDKEAMFIGASSHCEIWNKADWEAICSELDTSTILQVMDEIGF